MALGRRLLCYPQIDTFQEVEQALTSFMSLGLT